MCSAAIFRFGKAPKISIWIMQHKNVSIKSLLSPNENVHVIYLV